jgi:hypothetical protein
MLTPLPAAELHVISVISNPARYKTRVRLFREFTERMKRYGVTHWIVEATSGLHEPSIVDRCHPNHIHVRCDDELWVKENLINIGAQHAIQAGAKFLMWCDGDIHFLRDDWATETLSELQARAVVQPFGDVIDTGPDHEFHERQRGFAHCYIKGFELGPKNRFGGWEKCGPYDGGGPFWHPGYCWAFTVEAWDCLGGMLDRAILGSADFHMACALIGKADFSMRYRRDLGRDCHPNYRAMVKEWEARAERHIARNIGYVPGTIVHHFHGHKVNRKYQGRREILVKHQFNPHSDVHYDARGVLRLAHAHDARRRGLRDDLRLYFRARHEDAR